MNSQKSTQTKEGLEKSTIYIHSDQNLALDELIFRLRKRKVMTNRSELVRTAIDLLIKQDLDPLIAKITKL